MCGLLKLKKRAKMRNIMEVSEGVKFIPLNFPDPFGYGKIYTPIFPPRHHTMKAILDNVPETVEKIYVFGSSLRLDSAVNSDLDVFMVGSLTPEDLNRIYRAVPEGEKADILVETEDEFMRNLEDNYSSLYRKVYEGGYKIYERKNQ